MRRVLFVLSLSVLGFWATSVWAAGSGYTIEAASFLGGSGDDDAVVGVRIQADGAIVLAANLAADFSKGLTIGQTLGEPGRAGTVVRLSADGRKILSLLRLADKVQDLSSDGKDNLYVAAGATGAIKLPPQADKVLWTRDLEGSCDRIKAGADGHAVAVVAGKGGVVLAPDGKPLGVVPGKALTDACIDTASRTVVVISFRNAHAHDGKRREPVQICCVRGHGYDGQEEWRNYDWSTDQASDRFINKPTNNMADTRAYRCTIGRDGKLYVGFESAGGNHIFRYSPTNIMEKGPLVGGDAYHQFYGGGGAAHRTIFARFDPATGAIDCAQQWTGRTAENRCTNARMKQGGLAADEGGRIFLTGLAGARLPLDPDPCGTEQAAGGPYLLGMTPDFRGRLVCTRMQEQGGGHAVDARLIDGKVTVVYGGSGAVAGMFVKNAVQPAPQGKDGFFVLLRASPDAPPSNPPAKPMK
ncbi:MAG: hypothetical protein ABR915_14015 [Thermoguttaceae bacterium]|jgi:hypothetical protein